MTMQNAGKWNVADSDLDGLQPEHMDDEGATKDKPSQAKWLRHAANTPIALALATGNAADLDGLELEHADNESTPKDTLSHVKRLSRAVNGPGASQTSSRAASDESCPSLSGFIAMPVKSGSQSEVSELIRVLLSKSGDLDQ
ncbi:hypothetical protein OG21DRAFT_1491150 [Imleria badia]|nr:hypothetical protein OG21DRAFT_1491150 [Imleria badia]